MYTWNLMKIKLNRFWLSSLGHFVSMLIKRVNYLALHCFDIQSTRWRFYREASWVLCPIFMSLFNRVGQQFRQHQQNVQPSLIANIWNAQSIKYLMKVIPNKRRWVLNSIFTFLIIRDGQQFGQWQQNQQSPLTSNVWNAESIKYMFHILLSFLSII